jgi:hypothetical protein
VRVNKVGEEKVIVQSNATGLRGIDSIRTLLLVALLTVTPIFSVHSSSDSSPSKWVLDSRCEPKTFIDKAKRTFQRKKFWRDQFDAGNAEIRATERRIILEYLHLQSKISMLEPSLRLEITELAVEGVPSDLLASLISKKAESRVEEIRLSIQLIRETHPKYIEYLRGCLSKIENRF